MTFKVSLFLLILFVTNIAYPQSLEKLKDRKLRHDSSRSILEEKQLVFVKTLNGEVVRITNSLLPKNIQTTYNVLVDDPIDKTLLVGIYPYSESGDWFLEHVYYFDDNDQIFAYNHQLNFFNGICASIIQQKTLYYFDQDSKEIFKEYTLTDESGVDLTNKDCVFNYPYEPRFFNSLSEIIMEEGLNGW